MGYLNLVGSFVYKEPVFRSKLDALAENDSQLKTDGWAQNTKCLFFQSAVPAGWTQDVSQNDKAIRLVGSTGGGLSGGVAALSGTVTLAHTHALTTPNDGAHTHAYANHTHNLGIPGTNLRTSTVCVADDGAGFLFLFDSSGGSTTISRYEAVLKTPGALTLSTQANHNHGTPSSALTDFVFAYCDVIVGTKNAPGGTYTDLTNFWHTGDKIDFDPFTSYALNDAYTLGNLMPAGTIMIFGQPSASVGWTKIASINDRMLRIVSGAGAGSGGTQLISSGVSLSHTHVLTAVADHTHTVPDHSHTCDTDGSASATPADPAYGYIVADFLGRLSPCQQTPGLPTSSQTVLKATTTFGGGGTTGPADGHTHVLPNALADFILAYVDVIQCSKDSAGSPYAYTDYTAEFAWKKLVTYQRLNTLAKNDEYIHFHTTPFASQTFFFMSSPPAGWVKITSQHDKALRMVSGGTGGTPGGGAQLLSATIPLAHTHTIALDPDHTHSIAHTHPLQTGTKTIVTNAGFLADVRGSGMRGLIPGNIGPGVTLAATPSQNPNEALGVAGNHNHGGVTDSQLTDIVLAYADVIWCTKS